MINVATIFPKSRSLANNFFVLIVLFSPTPSNIFWCIFLEIKRKVYSFKYFYELINKIFLTVDIFLLHTLSRITVEKLKISSRIPATTTDHLPSSCLAFKDVGFPFGWRFIRVHFRVLHSKPYFPKAPIDDGTIGSIAEHQAIATKNLQMVRNQSLLMRVL